jgi:hypothetical protein
MVLERGGARENRGAPLRERAQRSVRSESLAAREEREEELLLLWLALRESERESPTNVWAFSTRERQAVHQSHSSGMTASALTCQRSP